MVTLIFGQLMKVAYKLFTLFIIRLGSLLSLIFFGLLLTACKQNNKEEITILWNNTQAAGISIPKSFITGKDSVADFLKICLENRNEAMLGDYTETTSEFVFKPVVPLSPGLRYQVFFRKNLLGKIQIPLADAKQAPKLVVIYPSGDTLPENLLKFYFQFSAPMRESEALKHISLTASNGDTLPGVFLDLQPELWNAERTVLTVWLDPGRIKRDLIPNKEMGNPLQNGKSYNLNIDREWKDVQGLPIQQAYTRKFFVGARDNISPDLRSWKLNIPAAQTMEPLQISTLEPLDYFLLQETIKIINEQGNAVEGSLRIKNKETALEFTPGSPWQAGIYRVRVASHLEDLAGNNLQRLFDRDISVKSKTKEEAFAERAFEITSVK